MLVLSRRSGQGVVIGEDAKITILEVRGDMVRLGIQAPRSVSVHRKEIYFQIAESNRRATGADAETVRRATSVRPPGDADSVQPPGTRLPSDRFAA